MRKTPQKKREKTVGAQKTFDFWLLFIGSRQQNVAQKPFKISIDILNDF